MAYKGLVANIPVGMQGFSGSRNPSQMGPGHLVAVEGLSLEGGVIQKEGGAQKLNSVALSGAVIAGTNWSPVAAANRDVVFTSAGELLKDDGSGSFSTTLRTGLSGVRVPPATFATGGGEDVGSPRKLFMFSSSNQVQVITGDGSTAVDLPTPPLDWASSFPTFGVPHAGRMWAGGNSSDPHRIYASTIDDHTNFMGTGDTYGSSVSLALNFVGSDGSTTFTDESLNEFAITPIGDVQIDTAQFKFGTSSALLDGTGDYLTAPDNGAFELGAGAFTLECWVRFSSVATAGLMAKGSTAGNTLSWELKYAGGNLVFVSSTSGTAATTTISNAWAPLPNIWYFVEVIRSGTNLRMFVDATQIGTSQTNSETFFSGAGLQYVGAAQAGATPLAGWLGGVRITKAVARHTADYTVPTTAFPDPTVPFSGAVNLPIYPGEGQGIVGGISFRGVLVLFKYPNGIYIVDTRDPSYLNWSVTKMSGAVGAINHSAIIQIENDVMYMDEGGNIHLLSATNDLGDINTSNISQMADMRPYIQSTAKLSQIRRTVGMWYSARRQAWFSMPSIASDDNDLRIAVDFNRSDIGPRFIPSRRDTAISMWLRPSSDGLSRPAIGDADGFVWTLDTASRNKDGAAYGLMFETSDTDLSFVDPSLAAKSKNGNFLELLYEPRGNWDLTVDVYWDGKLVDTLIFTMGQEGAAIGSFVIGTSKLTSTGVKPIRQRVAGSGRRFKLIGRNDGLNQDVAIASFFLSFNVADERTREDAA